MSFPVQDLRFAVRLMRRNPGFTLVAVAALALGIGSNTAIFSLVDGILLKPLPFQFPQQLVMVWQRNSAASTPQAAISPSDFLSYRERTHAFSGIVAMRAEDFHFLDGGGPVRFSGEVVSSNFFQMLGVQPVVGRSFRPEEEKRGNHRVVMLSYPAWQTYFGGDRGIIGQNIILNKEPYTIVGVLPRSMEEFRKSQIYVPMAFIPEELSTRNARYLYAMARLKPGMSRQDGDRDLRAVASQLAREYPATNAGWEAYSTPLLDEEVGNVRPALLVLMAAVGLVLLIACANVANLLLVRAASRQKEVSIRAALGAGRLRIVAQMLIEGFVLASISAVCGMLLAYGAVRAFAAYGPAGIPRLSSCRINWTVMLFTLGVTCLTTIVFGLAPSLHAVRSNVEGALREVGRGLYGGGRKLILRNLIVIGEVAFCTVLLVTAGLMLRSFYKLYRLDPGFNPDHVLAVWMSLSDEKYYDDATCNQFVDEVMRRVEGIPGVLSVAMGTSLPMMQVAWQAQIAPEGQAARPAGERDVVTYSAVTPGYFSTLGIPLLKGREFSARDRLGSPSVAIISETLAKRYFPREDPIGKKIDLTVSKYEHHCEIVGVVGDAKQVKLDELNRPMIYQPHAQSPWPYLAFAFRTSVPPLTLAGAVKAKFLEVEPNQAVDRVDTMNGMLNGTLANQRLAMYTMGLFGGMALLLACFGIYAVMAYSIAQRSQEFGVRISLGAQRGDIVRMVMNQGLTMAASGVAAGLVVSVLVTRLISSQLYGITATDPLTFAGVGLLLLLLAAAACLLPSLRAGSIDPSRVLRAE